MDLTDPQLAITLVSHVSHGGTTAEFADAHGVSRATVSRAITKACAANPELREKLDAARIGAKTLAHYKSRMMPASASVATSASVPASGLPSDEEFEAWLWTTAQNADHKAASRCADIIANLKYSGRIIAARKAAERADEKTNDGRVRRVNVDLPEPGSSRVIDAEVVETT